MKRFLGIIGILILHCSFSNAQNKTDDIVGIWQTGSKEPAKVQIYKLDKKYYGKIVWLKNAMTDNGKIKADINNPDKNKRNNTIVGLLILKDFEFDGKKEWKKGTIYDPESGKTYRSDLYLKDNNTIEIRGYIGISLLGKTQTWIRPN